MPRRKGAGQGKWRSKKTGKYVSSYYALRNPKNVERVEDSVDDAKREKTASGAYIVEGAAPKAGTVLTHKRLAKGLYSLNFGYDPEEKIAELEARIEQLEEGLRDILDVLTGWTRPLEDSEKLAFIEELAAKALSDSKPEHLNEGEETKDG